MSKSLSKKQSIGLAIVFLVLAYFSNEFPSQNTDTTSPSNVNIEQLIQQHQSDVQVNVTARVFKTLKDDLKGSRHQRFLIKISSGDTILIAHNIDLASKINNLRKGDSVTVYGEYEWNNKGGVIHWTHADPAHRHIDGWIEHNGKRYQ